MTTQIKGILLTKKVGTFTNKETQISFDYKNIEIGMKDANNNGSIIKLSVPKEISIENLIIHNTYTMEIELPTQLNEKAKYRLVSILVEK